MPLNPAGFIPIFGQGLRAREHQPGTDGGKEWLKTIKLHKYWPTFSQWSYSEFMSLTRENLDSRLAGVRSAGMTTGAKGRLLQNVQLLRERDHALDKILSTVWSGTVVPKFALKYLKTVLRTPLPTEPGSRIATAIVATVLEVQTFILKQNYGYCIDGQMGDIWNGLLKRPALSTTFELIQKGTFIKRPVIQSGGELENPEVNLQNVIWPQENNCVMFGNIWPESSHKKLRTATDINVPRYPWEAPLQSYMFVDRFVLELECFVE